MLGCAAQSTLPDTQVWEVDAQRVYIVKLPRKERKPNTWYPIYLVNNVLICSQAAVSGPANFTN